MRYYNSLGDAGYPISEPCTTMPCSFDEHQARGSRGGVDFAVGVGTPVIAPTKGRVDNWTNSSAGNAVNFYHIGDDGNETGFYDQFMHLSAFVSEGIYEPGATIGFSGNTGSSTGPHIHWDLVNPAGTVVRQWEYFTNDPTTTKGSTMFLIRVLANGWHYVVGAEYIRLITGAEVPQAAVNMGAPKDMGRLEDFILFCQSLNIPTTIVSALNQNNRTWSKLDTISGGGGATPEAIAKAVDASLKDDFAAIPKSVNDDVAKRMSS